MTTKLAVSIMGLLLIGPAASNLPSAEANAADIERGKYLVERVSLCADCHSPRNEKGEFVRSKWLQGSPLGFKPIQAVPHWRDAAPPIAGLPGWTDEQAIKFFETALGRDGKPADPPMPSYKMSHRDAATVVAYLRSLSSSKPASGNTK